MKILTVIGARPQFIKAAAVSRAVEKNPDLREIIIHTGQHFNTNMSDIFFEEMGIPKPDYNLGISSLSHGAMTGRMIEEIEKVLIHEKPDALVTYGDTNSTLASAIAASKLGLPIAHIEAGLRSFNMAMPEEINRILTDRISNLLLCPTETAMVNLQNEGIENNEYQKAFKVGDVMFDAAQYYSEISATKSTIRTSLDFPYSLVTIHRAENTDNIDKLTSIISALNEIAGTEILVFPIHPRTRNILSKSNISLSSNIKLIDPVGYFDMIELIKGSNLVLTDSGGLQKEAYFFNKPCLTLRDETEWVELVDTGVNQLAGKNKQDVVDGFMRMKNVNIDNLKHQLFGNGHAADKIVEIIYNTYTGKF